MEDKVKAGSIESLKQRLGKEGKEKRPSIPSKILAGLINGDKIPVYMKYGSCVGLTWWDGEKLRFSANADLK